MTEVVSTRTAMSGRRGRDRGALEGQVASALSDAGLVIAMARGRSDALAESYRRYGLSVYGLAESRWGQRRGEVATLEIFLALWRRPDTVDLDRGSLRSHLMAGLGPIDTDFHQRPSAVDSVSRPLSSRT